MYLCLASGNQKGVVEMNYLVLSIVAVLVYKIHAIAMLENRVTMKNEIDNNIDKITRKKDVILISPICMDIHVHYQIKNCKK